MAEPNSGGTPGGPGKPKELSMELRLLLAFILMGVVLFLTPYFYKTVSAAGEEDRSGWRRSTEPAPAAPAAPTPAPSAAAPAAPPDLTCRAARGRAEGRDSHHRYRSFSYHLQQSRRRGEKLAAEKVQGA